MLKSEEGCTIKSLPYNNKSNNNMSKEIKIAVAGTGYVGLSIATLLAQHHPVTAVDVILGREGIAIDSYVGWSVCIP